MTRAAGGRLAATIVCFGRTLRSAGVPLGPAQIVEALRAVAAVGIREREDFRCALRACLLRDPAHFALFDQAFRIFFGRPGLLERALATVAESAPPRPDDPAAPRRPAGATSVPAAGVQRQADVPADVPAAGYSSLERLRDKDFQAMTPTERRDAERLLRLEITAPSELPSRRYRRRSPGTMPDLRTSMQRMLRHDGELLSIVRKRRRTRPPAVVLLCDVSGSMSAYSRMFLLFAHALTSRPIPVHTFVFGTRLTNVTRRLRRRDADEALAAVTSDVSDWDGGTRIAESIRRFNLDWGRRVLAQNAVVILLSDGLERDTTADLSFQTARLRRSCRQLVWLNPLLRYAGFQPLAFGIRSMLPQVDRFLPAHNVRSLAALGRLVARDRRRSPFGFYGADA